MSKTKEQECQLGDRHPFIRCSLHHIPLTLVQLEPEQWRCQQCRDEQIMIGHEHVYR